MTVHPYQTFGYQKPPYGTRVDWSHPLAKNLVVAATFSEGQGIRLHNEGLAEIEGTILNASNPWNALSGFNNPTHIDLDGMNDVLDFGSHSRTAINYGDSAIGMSFCALLHSRSNGTIFAKRDGAVVELHLFDEASVLRWKVGGTSVDLVTSTEGYTRDNWHLISGSADAVGDCQGYINGNSALLAVSDTPVRQNVNFSVGGRWNSYPTVISALEGDIAFVYIWTDRYLSAEEHAQLALDPYQMYEDRSRRAGFLVTTAAAIEQEGFRFRNDDGSEAAATWRQVQDVVDTVAADTNIRLRILLNATGDPASSAFQLEYRKVGAADWHKVDIEN